MESSLTENDNNNQGFIENLNLMPKNYGILKQYANRIVSYSAFTEVSWILFLGIKNKEVFNFFLMKFLRMMVYGI
jgi:hypothetical protein